MDNEDRINDTGSLLCRREPDSAFQHELASEWAKRKLRLRICTLKSPPYLTESKFSTVLKSIRRRETQLASQSQNSSDRNLRKYWYFNAIYFTERPRRQKQRFKKYDEFERVSTIFDQNGDTLPRSFVSYEYLDISATASVFGNGKYLRQRWVSSATANVFGWLSKFVWFKGWRVDHLILLASVHSSIPSSDFHSINQQVFTGAFLDVFTSFQPTRRGSVHRTSSIRMNLFPDHAFVFPTKGAICNTKTANICWDALSKMFSTRPHNVAPEEPCSSTSDESCQGVAYHS